VKGAIVPLLALGICCAGHLVVPVLLALGPAALVGLVTGAVPVVLVVAALGIVAALWLHRRRPDGALSVPLDERG
jgi:hypothetical protein